MITPKPPSPGWIDWSTVRTTFSVSNVPGTVGVVSRITRVSCTLSAPVGSFTPKPSARLYFVCLVGSNIHFRAEHGRVHSRGDSPLGVGRPGAEREAGQDQTRGESHADGQMERFHDSPLSGRGGPQQSCWSDSRTCANRVPRRIRGKSRTLG